MDRFDDIWKNRFNEEEVPQSDWNTPDEDVWEGIAPHVAPKKNKRSLWMIWLGIGLLILLLLSILALGNDTQRLSNQTATFENSILEREEPTFKIAKADAAQEEIIPVNGKERSHQFNPINEALSINVSPKKENFSNTPILKSKNQTISNPENSSTKLLSEQVNSKPELSTNSSVSKRIENVILTDGTINKTLEEESKSVPSLVMFLSSGKDIRPIPFLPKSLIEFESTNKFNYTLGFRAGATYWKHRISDDYTSDLSPFDFNYQDEWGWQSSLSLNVEISNYFDATLGLQFDQVKTNSGHNSELTYSLADEENPSDPLNQYALSLATPYGLSGATFNFNRAQNISTNDVDLLVDFHSRHLIRNLSLPIGTVFYPLGKNRKFQPTVSAGFGVNYLAQINNKIQSIETNHDAIQYDDSGSSTFVSPDVEKWHFDYRLGVGVQYKIQRNLNLQLNYNWINGLNPIYQLDQYETRIDRHQISIGLIRSITP